MMNPQLVVTENVIVLLMWWSKSDRKQKKSTVHDRATKKTGRYEAPKIKTNFRLTIFHDNNLVPTPFVPYYKEDQMKLVVMNIDADIPAKSMRVLSEPSGYFFFF